MFNRGNNSKHLCLILNLRRKAITCNHSVWCLLYMFCMYFNYICIYFNQNKNISFYLQFSNNSFCFWDIDFYQTLSMHFWYDHKIFSFIHIINVTGFFSREMFIFIPVFNLHTVNFTLLNTVPHAHLCTKLLTEIPTFGNYWSVLGPCIFAFFRMSHKWSHRL